VFFGGQSYLPFFDALTSGCTAERTVFYNSAVPPRGDGWRALRYKTTLKTNWHYACARDFAARWRKRASQARSQGDPGGSVTQP
jgi:hypothetical protein